ncbi:hypothetical protein B0H17DRAFT_1065667 [Mycena rosella]|uniref:Uncharacterized protein n=1 Tax=Mycena rosella TaxID=1033263 RepID=A0AAD7DFL7_MYCRO|nr:hypothetical protein B0H17DRAFT_1065667 [Mycena rosella]
MQLKVIAFVTALFVVSAAQITPNPCLTILAGSICPVGYRVCTPSVVGQTKCCPNTITPCPSQTTHPCLIILAETICPVGYIVCGPFVVGQTKCCPDTSTSCPL